MFVFIDRWAYFVCRKTIIYTRLVEWMCFIMQLNNIETIDRMDRMRRDDL